MSNGTTWLVPPGVIVAYAGNPTSDPPQYWAYCNGQSVSNSSTDPDYTDLYAVVGTAYGGDGQSNFNLPDFRGYFLRGVDDGAGRDPDTNSRGSGPNGGNSGNAVGSTQSYGVQQLGASVPTQYGAGDQEASAEFGYNSNNILGGIIAGNPNTYSTVAAWTSPVTSETRPLNIYVYYLICLGVPAA